MKRPPLRQSEPVRCPGGSWWLTAERSGFAQRAQQEVPRMRRNGVSFFNPELGQAEGKRLLKKMRSAL